LTPHFLIFWLSPTQFFSDVLAVRKIKGLQPSGLFRCSSCTAENMIGCPRVDADCTEVVREPGCGCCPVCARMEGEFCGVYTPRCSSGLICYPTMDAELPLEQLIQGFGDCFLRGAPVCLGIPLRLLHPLHENRKYNCRVSGECRDTVSYMH
uniref:Insulin-like growth factor binding protein 2b n=1 Tax=Oryzias melastigma TaxID=30732 RepID=A0A3B3DW60_ORYME